MTFRLGFELRTRRLYNGCRSVWLAFHWGTLTYYASRWDTARQPRNRLRTGPMGWTFGCLNPGA